MNPPPSPSSVGLEDKMEKYKINSFWYNGILPEPPLGRVPESMTESLFYKLLREAAEEKKKFIQ